ncbi:hypothetical protein ACFTY8_14995 [Streptomyces mirabilis]|uniref:hypothetical protein n=1 Tax=Streptomyces mirabilis TaxID=68239 RepID=UPI0036437EB5
MSELLAPARQRGLALGDLDLLAARASRPALVIGYATPPDHAFGGALDRLCEVLSEAADRSDRPHRPEGPRPPTAPSP